MIFSAMPCLAWITNCSPIQSCTRRAMLVPQIPRRPASLARAMFLGHPCFTPRRHVLRGPQTVHQSDVVQREELVVLDGSRATSQIAPCNREQISRAEYHSVGDFLQPSRHANSTNPSKTCHASRVHHRFKAADGTPIVALCSRNLQAPLSIPQSQTLDD